MFSMFRKKIVSTFSMFSTFSTCRKSALDPIYILYLLHIQKQATTNQKINKKCLHLCSACRKRYILCTFRKIYSLHVQHIQKKYIVITHLTHLEKIIFCTSSTIRKIIFLACLAYLEKESLTPRTFCVCSTFRKKYIFFAHLAHLETIYSSHVQKK